MLCAMPRTPKRDRLVGLDQRVELVEGLAIAAGLREDDLSPAAVLARKALPKKHAAVRRFSKMTPTDWRHRTPAMIVLDFADPPGLEIAAHADHYANAGKDDAISRLLPELRDWAALPAVREWLGEAERACAREVAEVRAVIEKADYERAVEEYLGLPLPHRYRWIVSPLARGVNGQNVLYRRADGLCDIYSISSLSEATKAKIADFQDTAWHEICHTVVDGWTHEVGPEVDAHEGLYALMRGRAKTEYQGPPGWRHMVDEHIIRSTCARLAGLARGEAHGTRAMEDERKDGFVLIGAFYESLKRYERERKRYKTLRDFYPVFVDLLARAGAKRQ
jgi:hypothetical protein